MSPIFAVLLTAYVSFSDTFLSYSAPAFPNHCLLSCVWKLVRSRFLDILCIVVVKTTEWGGGVDLFENLTKQVLCRPYKMAYFRLQPNKINSGAIFLR